MSDTPVDELTVMRTDALRVLLAATRRSLFARAPPPTTSVCYWAEAKRACTSEMGAHTSR
jgi:hypothetical protein